MIKGFPLEGFLLNRASKPGFFSLLCMIERQDVTLQRDMISVCPSAISSLNQFFVTAPLTFSELHLPGVQVSTMVEMER